MTDTITATFTQIEILAPERSTSLKITKSLKGRTMPAPFQNIVLTNEGKGLFRFSPEIELTGSEDQVGKEFPASVLEAVLGLLPTKLRGEREHCVILEYSAKSI